MQLNQISIDGASDRGRGFANTPWRNRVAAAAGGWILRISCGDEGTSSLYIQGVGANWIMGSTLFFGYFLLFYYFLILETKECEDLKDRWYREVSKMVFPREKISQKWV